MLAAGQLVKFFGPKHTGLVQKLVNQRCFAVVNMGDYRHITNII
jgi:hypothetical protein